MKKLVLLIVLAFLVVGCANYLGTATGQATGNQITQAQFEEIYSNSYNQNLKFTKDGRTVCFEPTGRPVRPEVPGRTGGTTSDDGRTGGGVPAPDASYTPPTISYEPGYVDIGLLEKEEKKASEPIKWEDWCYDDPEHPLYGFGCECNQPSDCDQYEKAKWCVFKDSKFPSEGKICTIACPNEEGLICPYVKKIR